MTKYLLLLAFMSLSVIAVAQEASCGDGIDNDGDGFIDCFDSDCGGNAVCQGTYIGNDADCEIPQPPGSDFSMVLENESNEHVSSTHGRFVIGDMGDLVNGKDGIPEIVTAHTSDKKIYILDGQTLDIKNEATSPNRIDRYDIAIADVAKNGCARIFVAEVATERVCVRYRSNGTCREYEDVTKHYVSSWDCEANFLWRTEVHARPFTLALADFDADGNAELYFRNQILDAVTGQVVIAGSGDWSQVDGGPVAVDILDDSECADCAGLELVAGGEIYSVNLNAPGAIDGGTLTLVKQFNDIPSLNANDEWHTKSLDLDNDEFVNSQTSIADFDQDGFLDVLMTGTSNSGKTTVFYWNVRNNSGDIYRPANNWKYGAGRLNLADLDGDGQMNVAFVSGSYLYALDENLDLMWRIAIDEETSGYTSTTVFDFNNDGASEIVYRDETYLYIIKGDGTFSPPINCKSLTSNDYPIVADVDADGSTEICVICQDDFNDSNYAGANEGVIRTYKSGNEPWVSARKVWNQHGYFNVNINDDLTIPQFQQKHHLVFSEDQCGPGENRVLNSFLNQSAILNTDGCKTYPSADITFVANPNLLNVIPPTCPDEEFHISFTLRNIGSLDLTADIPITFYSGDPLAAGAVKLGTQIISVTNFRKGNQLVVPDMTISGTGGMFTLFAVLNDNGLSPTTPIDFPNSGIDECNLGNNIASASVNPQAFQLSTSFTDHIQCGATPSPPNGSVKAFKPEGAVEQTVGYTFYWFDGMTAGAPGSADHTGSEITNLSNGTYTVYALHDAYQCGSDTVQVTVGQQALTIGATVNVDQPYTNCNSPDGQLSVIPDSGNINDYTYEWFEGTVFGTSPTLSDSSVLRFTKALTYSVLVTQTASGCQTLESGTVPDMTVTPSVNTAFVPANCAPPNSGQASADVGGTTLGYTFYWYDGTTAKPTEDFLGASYSGITAGNYTVIARDNTTGCSSNETVVMVTSVSGITVTANITAQQTSCALPNGSASAHVGNVTAGYSFKWFDGNNAINQIGANPTITGLAAGDYTVQATNLATGCTDTELITIVDNIQTPSVTPSVTAHQTDCLPPDGAVGATAAGSPGPFIFYWFDGNIGTPDTTSADFKGAQYTGVAAGFYTVVAVDANTRCAAARGVVQVLDQTVNPVVTTSTTGQTSCDPASPNGQATASVGGVTAGYKFRWFSGADTTTFLLQSPVLPNRPAGTYTVKAINTSTGCYATKLVVINDISAKPTLSLVKVDNNVCVASIGYTGSVTASFATNPNSQPGHTYTYAWRKNGAIIPGESGPSINGLNAGTYEVTVLNQALGCISDPVSVIVNDAVVLPAITTSFAGSTNCTGSPNGTVTVTVPAAGAEYRWYEGATAGAGPLLNSATINPAATGLQGGAGRNYTAEVTLTATGCKNTATVLLPDNSELPELGPLSKVDNTLCVGSNGQANVGTVTYQSTAVAMPNVGYTLSWSNGGTTPSITAVVAGTYSLTVTKTDVGCTSAPVSIVVNDNLTYPAITTSFVASTNCAGPANGSVTVTGPAAGAEYRWYSGITAGVGAMLNSAVTDPMATGLQGGAGQNYTAEVTLTATGCKNTATVLLPDNSELPVLGPLSIVDNTLCVGSNGQVAVGTVTYKSAAVVIPDAGYTLSWSNGGSSPSITALAAGVYSLTVTKTDVGCTSAPVSATIANNLTLPVISTSATPSTNCAGGLANGTAIVTGVAPAGPYEYRWYSGNTIGAPGSEINSGLADADIDNRQGAPNAFHTVEVTIQATGCKNSATVLIADISEKPVISSLDHSDNLNCTLPFNGAVSVPVGAVSYHGAVIASPYTGFSLLWSDGSSAENISGLASGSYSLTMTHVDDNCTSDPVSVNVGDDLTYPAISATVVNEQTSCDPGSPNGQLQATETSGVGAYSFDWYNGIGVGAPGSELAEQVEGTTTRVLSSNDYTVKVANSATRCESTATIFLPDNIVNPSIAFNNIIGVTSCAAPNGSATPVLSDVSTPLTPDFTVFYVRTFSDATNPAIPPSDPLVIKASVDTYASTAAIGVGNPPDVVGLMPGFLTALVVDNNTTCESSPVTITINDATTANQITPGPVLPAGFCGGSGGSIDITPSGGVGGYTFEWYEGTPSNANINFFNNPPNMGAAPLVTNAEDLGLISPAGGVESATYTVVMRDAAGCGTYLIQNVPFVGFPAVTITTVDVTQCDPGPYDGEVNISVAGTAGVNYDLTLFQGNGPGVNLGNASGIANVVLNTTNLAHGDYFIRLVDNINAACPLDYSASLDKLAFNPSVAIDLINPNTACDLTNADGSVRITVALDARDSRPLATPIEFQVSSVTPLPENPPAFPVLLGSGVASVTQDLNYGFRPQSYTLRVSEVSSGCFTDQSVTIPNQPVVPDITVAVTDETLCAPGSNGGAEVTAMNPAAIADYQFSWYSDAGLTTLLYQDNGGAGGEIYNASKAGYLPLGPAGSGPGNKTFYLRAQRRAGTGAGAGCNSPGVTAVIHDNHASPAPILTALSNTSCDPVFGEGSISVETTTDTGGADPAVENATYTYSLNPAVAGPFAAMSGALSTPFVNLTHNGGAPYTVSAYNEVNGCVTARNVTVPDTKFPIQISNLVVTDKLMCNPDGDITVSEIVIERSLTSQPDQTFNTPASVAGNFEFRWFKGVSGTFTSGAPLNDNSPSAIDGPVLVVGTGAGEYDDPSPTFGAGTYFVVARQLSGAGRSGANCESTPISVEIKDESEDPVITLTPFTNTSCDPVVFEGQVEVDVTDASVVPGVFSYTYGWTALTAGRTAPLTPGNPYDGVDDLFIAMQDGDYSLSATNTVTGCTTTAQTTVQQNTTPIFLQNVDADAQLFCTPSGSLEVREITFIDRLGVTQSVTGASLSDFSFTWFKGGLAAANQIGGAAGLLDSVAYAGIGTDPDYYVVATRTSNAPGRDCSSAPFRIGIPDERVFPEVALTPFTNTSCDPVVFEGLVEVTVTDQSVVPGAYSYNYAWTALTAGRTAPLTPANPYDGSNNMFTAVQDGDYSLSATNTVTGCTTIAQTTVQQNTTPIFLQNVDVDAQFFCTPSGSLEVREITFVDRTGVTQSVTGASLSDFSFTWFKDGLAAANQIGGAGGLLDSVAYAGIGTDPDYYVVATRVSNAPGRDCSSAPFKVEIPDAREYPVVAFNSTGNTTCLSNTFDGAITVTTTTAGLGSAANYSIVWTSKPGAPVSIADQLNAGGIYTTPATDNIGVGLYTATVTNLVTQCQTTGSVTVLQNSIPVQILDVTKVDQRDCAPFDGSINIDTNDPAQISVPGSYTFAWEKAGVSLAPVPDNTLTGVDAGVYTVTGTKTSGLSAGCATAPFSVTLLDLTKRPVLELQSVANYACDPAFANGQISAIIFEDTNVAPVADYSLSWFAGKNVTSGPILGMSDVLSNRIQGDYTLLAMDNVSPNRGCENSSTIPIDFDETSFSVAVVTADQDLCAPLQNGSVSVTGITEVRNGTATPAANLALYAYQWFDDNGTPHPSTPAFTPGVVSINNALAGDYQVQVRNSLGCISTATAGLVKDMTVLPVITLENFLNPTVCVMPETAGYLQVSADNSLNFSDYTFEWFAGADDTGALVEPNNATLGNIMYNQPLQYTVRVTNIATNCMNLDSYRFAVDTVEVQVLASAVGRTNCLVDDGSLFATTLNGAGALYNYEWYAGSTATGTPVYTTKQVTGAPIGQYTVIAVNPNHAFCKSTAYTTRVTDERILPPVIAVQRNPLTYCDPANPNGVAFASVNNGVVGYTFDWFQGAVGGAPIYTGPEVKGLTSTTYVVRATNVLTGCEQTASILIENDPVNVPEPAVVVISHHTNCVDPDGVLAASVNGVTAGYLLQWYDGNSVRSIADAIGEFYYDLEDGFYTVTATDNISGCVSDPVVAEVLPFREDPEFDIETMPTNCEENIGGASLVMLNDVGISTIEWNGNGVMEYGARVADLPKGEFNVTVTSYLQCTVSKPFIIEPEVLVFNGVSRNNDGQNDFFEIACIQDFPQNNVKIFNRAGTLVYEADGYDNQDVFFDGVSNRGISLLGTDLPDGTYFYIIDKRNGSKPRTGYLELLR